MKKTKRCKDCATEKPVDRFLPSVATADGLKPICSNCYFANNNGRAPRGFKYESPAGAMKVWLTQGFLGLHPKHSAIVNVAEAVPVDGDPSRIETLPRRWGDLGSRYVKPDWHTSLDAVKAELIRLAREVEDDLRKEYQAALARRQKIERGEDVAFTDY